MNIIFHICNNGIWSNAYGSLLKMPYIYFCGQKLDFQARNVSLPKKFSNFTALPCESQNYIYNCGGFSSCHIIGKKT